MEVRRTDKQAKDRLILPKRNGGMVTTGNTVVWYAGKIKPLLDWLDKRGLMPAETTVDDLKDYRTSLLACGAAQNHAQRSDCNEDVLLVDGRGWDYPKQHEQRRTRSRELSLRSDEEQAAALLASMNTRSWVGFRVRIVSPALTKGRV